MHEREQSGDLVSRARGGDQGAWACLYRAAYPRLLAYAHHRLGSVEEAADAVSETMARAVGRIEHYRGDDDGGFTPWLFGILRHVVGDAFRQRTRLGGQEVPDIAADEPDPAEQLLAGEDRKLVRAAFARLDAEEREVLGLRVVGGLSSDGVAEALGKKPSAVRMAQMRALSRLRAFMEEATRVG